MPLLMIPGPIEISDAVIEAASGPPPGHLAGPFVEAFGLALKRMREVWRAGADAQPFVMAGSGTIAMEVAATNLLDPGDRALVVDTGYFSERMAEMLRRRGALPTLVRAAPGEAPSIEAVTAALDEGAYKALFATHVDTSTGVRVDAKALARAARERGLLSVFDGVCATAAERFEMEAWGADLYLTASQKAIGLPAGLALLVASPRALEARSALATPPPLSLDLLAWLPIMRAYEGGEKAYFSTPATTLVRALAVGLEEILEDGMEARFALHQRGADAMRAAWSAMGLSLLPKRPELAANTLSAILYPEGVGPALVPAIAARGVIVAGGLHRDLKDRYFRVGHMGHVLTRAADLEKTVAAVAEALRDQGYEASIEDALGAFRAVWNE